MASLQRLLAFLNAVEQPDCALDGVLLFNAAIFDRQSAERMVQLFTLLMQRVVLSPDAKVDLSTEEGPRRSAAERSQGCTRAMDNS